MGHRDSRNALEIILSRWKRERTAHIYRGGRNPRIASSNASTLSSTSTVSRDRGRAPISYRERVFKNSSSPRYGRAHVQDVGICWDGRQGLLLSDCNKGADTKVRRLAASASNSTKASLYIVCVACPLVHTFTEPVHAPSLYQTSFLRAIESTHKSPPSGFLKVDPHGLCQERAALFMDD